MAKVLENFLIGVGLDTEKYDQGAKKVENSLGRMRSLVGLAGAAIAGAFGAAGLAAINAGRRVDRMNLEFQKFRTPPRYIYDYGNAIRALGGNADEAAAAIDTAESRLASFRQTGEFPGLEQLQMAGLDMGTLAHENTGQDFMRELARQMPSLSKEQQFRVQEILGLSDAVMRSLRGGVFELDQAVERAHGLAGNLDDATGAARDFNKELAEFDTRMDGIGNTLVQNVLPGFTGLLRQFDGFLDSHKEEINKGLEFAGKHPAATALAAGGGALASGGVLLRGLVPGGIGAAGARLARLGTWGALAGAGLLAGDIAVNGLSDEQRRRLNEGGPLVHFGPEGARDPAGFMNDGLPGADRSPLDDGQSGDSQSLPLDRWNYARLPWAGPITTNDEAAAANPDVVMIRDQRERAAQPATTPRVNVQNHIDLGLTLDGHALDHKIDSVVQRRENETADDIQSSVDR